MFTIRCIALQIEFYVNTLPQAHNQYLVVNNGRFLDHHQRSIPYS